MTVAIDDRKVFALAKQIAADAAARDGQDEWCVHEVHIRRAREQIAAESGGAMRKVVTAPSAEDERLTREALRLEGLHKLGLLGSTDDRQRLEFGTVSTSFGELVTSHDRQANVLSIHSVEVKLGSIDARLREAIVVSSADFAAAEDQAEQAGQRAIIGAVVEAILRRHDDVGAKVKAAVDKQRYD